jgi:hypothetical protein
VPVRFGARWSARLIRTRIRRRPISPAIIATGEPRLPSAKSCDLNPPDSRHRFSFFSKGSLKSREISAGYGFALFNNSSRRSLPLVIQRMAAEVRMDPAEMFALEVRKVQVLQAGTAECAIRRMVQFLARRVVD